MTRAEDDAALADSALADAALADSALADSALVDRMLGSTAVTPVGDGRPARRGPVPADVSRPVHERWLSAVAERHTAVPLASVAERALAAGLRRVDLVAWRDLDDPEAGGSEIHAHEVASRWAAAGLDVHLSTSAVPGLPARARRSGYHVTRRGGRYAVFPRTALRAVGRRSGRDGLVEIWNGMPFLSPLWSRCPRVVFLHHVHAEMWRMVLPGSLAVAGELVERRLAPPLYRGARVVTLSASSRLEIVGMLGLDPGRVSVVPPGVDPRFSPGGVRSTTPLVVAVGRLVPVKRFDRLIDALAVLRRRHPGLRAVVVGEGYERPRLEAQIAGLGAGGWIELPGRLGDDELIDLYRRAWVLASTSQREGWGMTITEAAACGTPAVVSRIAGHRDAVDDGRTGLLVDDSDGLVAALDHLLADDGWRHRLGRGALERARRLTWEATAAGTLDALVAETVRRRR